MQSQHRSRPSEKASVPALGDHLKEYFTRPDVVELQKPVGAAGDGPLTAFLGFFALVGALLQGIASAPPSAGYEPWLTKRGFNRISARGLSAIVVSAGRRIANNDARRPAVVEAIRFLARRSRVGKPVSRRVNTLLAAWEESSAIEEIFEDAGRDEFEFIRLLEAISAGDQVAFNRLKQIAADLVPDLPTKRGRKLSAPSAAHEYFLQEVVRLRQKVAWTWSAAEERFTDDLTNATSCEFDDPSFDPRPACRRVNNRRRLI